ncbi:ABC transporter permease [Saccharibacillus sp. O16]|nr:ABC transporter permease [Saccharibacillus sp. O16]
MNVKAYDRSKAKRFLLGGSDRQGLIGQTAAYVLLIGIGFVFLYPLLFMISTSFKSLDDLLDSAVNWIPSHFYLDNYRRALEVLDYFPVLMQTALVTLLPSIIQTFMAAVIGFGFARFRFRGRNILLLLVLFTFLIPPQVTVIPRYILFNELGILDTLAAYIYPAFFGQGINAAIFILIFYQTFRQMPDALEEAAQLDGAGHPTIFFRIAIPMAASAFIVSFLFSLVWYWNETYLASIYFGESLTTLPLQLQKFTATYQAMFASASSASGGTNINEGIELAGTLLTILPLLVIYFVAQRWFVESMDRSGIAGE